MHNANRPQTMKQPHDNWATFYDFVYDKTFGRFYHDLTTETLNVINDIIPNGSIIDFGAGTGRLSIPLTEQNYSVVAVEKSRGMVEQFRTNQIKHNLDIQIKNCSIAEYDNGKADLAIALFTVLSYLVSEQELSETINNICRHIKPNGYFFFDLPNMVFFNAGRITNIQTEYFNRSVELTNSSNDIFTYKETCNGIFNGQKFEYQDEFNIRYWSPNTLDNLLRENGFVDTNKAFTQFSSTGSTYKLYKKQ